MSASPQRLLEIYLADHAAAAAAGAALARRIAQKNAATSFGEPLRRLAAEIEEDRRTLKRVIAELGYRESRTKEALAWTAEKIGRLKLNGQLKGYSPLSRLVELETLSVGIAGKLALWQSLQLVSGIGERLPDLDLDEMAERARSQRDEVEQQRRQAARLAFGSSS